MKYMHDTRANKMEEGHDTIQAKKRAIHDDTHIWGKTDPTFGGNPIPIRTLPEPGDSNCAPPREKKGLWRHYLSSK